MKQFSTLQVVIIAVLLVGVTAVVTALVTRDVSDVDTAVATVIADMDLDQPVQRQSYSLGTDIGASLADVGAVDIIDVAAVTAGMSDVFADEVKLTDDQIYEAMMAFQEALSQVAEQRAEAAREEGEQFLQENAQREGVVSTDSGLQYEILESGDADGVSPTRADAVVAHYEGRFIDGDVFDSSIERGQPATFGVTGVIEGWTEALQLMRPGDKWRLYIPHNLAYGPRGRDGIPGYATLIFDVEMLEVRQAPQ